MSTRIPLLGKSLGEVLNGDPRPLLLNANNIGQVTAAVDDPAGRMFVVTLTRDGAVTHGVQNGDAVTFQSVVGAEVEGQVSYVGPGEIGIRFTGIAEPDRTTPSLTIHCRGGLAAQFRAALGSLTDLGQINLEVPTLQELVRDLARYIGVDVAAIDLQVTGTDADRAIELTLPLQLDPLTFEETIDLSGQIPGIQLSGATKVLTSVAPVFHFRLGIRAGSGLSPGERIFIVDDATPEVTLNITAQLDDPVIRGSLGLLDLTLREQNLGVGVTNDGLKITGTFTVNLNEPGAGDGRITLADLQAGSLTSFVEAALDARFDIDGLELVPGGALAGSLGTLKLSLNGDTAGHVTSLADLTNLPSAITVTGLDEFLNFDNLSAAAIQLILQQLRGWLDDLRGSSVFATGLPLTGKSLGDVIDVGRGSFDSVVGILDNPQLVAEGLASVDGRLPQDVTVSLSVNDTIDLNFTILASQTAR